MIGIRERQQIVDASGETLGFRDAPSLPIRASQVHLHLDPPGYR
jgi:hypothetical protein